MSTAVDTTVGTAGPAAAQAPPQDLYAEQCTLGAMLISPAALDDVAGMLTGDEFYRPAHRLVFAAATALFAAGEPVDPVTVAAELTRRGELARCGGAPYLHTLVAGVPVATNATYYAHVVRDRAVLRHVVEAGIRITQLGYRAADSSASGPGSAEEVADRAQAELFAVAAGRRVDDLVPLHALLPAALDAVEAAGSAAGPAGVATGFAQLDALTAGLQPGQLVVVAARPSVGKSTLATDWLRAAAVHAGAPAALFSLEMGRTEVLLRVLAAESGVPLQALRTGALGDGEWSALVRRAGEIASAPLFIDDSPDLTVLQIRAKARRIAARHGLRLLVVDYLQLLTGSGRAETRQLEVAAASRSLKLLAKELEVPVVAVSQLNRNPESRPDRRPQLADLRDSGAIEMDADLVVLLYRDLAGFPETAEHAELIVAKNRNGPAGVTLPIRFDGPYARFTDAS